MRKKVGYGRGGSGPVAGGSATVMLAMATLVLSYNYWVAPLVPPWYIWWTSITTVMLTTAATLVQHNMLMRASPLLSNNRWTSDTTVMHRCYLPDLGSQTFYTAMLQPSNRLFSGTLIYALCCFFSEISASTLCTACGALPHCCGTTCHPPPILTGKLDQKPAAETDCLRGGCCNFLAKIFIFDVSDGGYGQDCRVLGNKLSLVSARKSSLSINFTKPRILCQTWSGQ